MRGKPYRAGWLFLLWLLVSACAAQPTPVVPEPSPTATPAEAVTDATATPTSAPDVEPTASSTPLPATPLATCPIAPDAAFVNLWQQVGGDASACPTEEAIERAGGYEPFERGLMLWVAGPESDRDGTIYVLFADGTWQVHPDTWTEDQPGRADLTPPPGLLEPERGFGKVWREQVGGTESGLGWATAREEGVEMTLQPLSGTGVMLAFDETVYYLPEGGSWVSN